MEWPRISRYAILDCTSDSFSSMQWPVAYGDWGVASAMDSYAAFGPQGALGGFGLARVAMC
ncbi:hypothetical protein BTUL_0292g00110 [Botrytis tulipae]|uniref:Uncharacterized protein n=1 Tax=Botrytis tulipae TaxID=87230 RepID=A0A4Z1E5F0_9HELO|nr:hypothetical protein BTUL_0292g00110 [Botrytis tulipae]